MNPTSQRPGSYSLVRKLLPLIIKGGVFERLPGLSLKPYVLRASKKGARSAGVKALAPVFEKSATELKHKQKFLKCKSIIHIATFNVRTLNRIDQLPELRGSALEHNIDIVCIQEHRYPHSELEIKYHDTGNGWKFISASAWKNSVNADVGGIGIPSQ